MGRRRIGLAISDVSGTLARPLETLTLAERGTPERIAERVAETIARLTEDEDGLTAVVVGLPTRLDGTPNDETPRVEAFIGALRQRTTLPVVAEGERLSSHEAESRLALGERDWRKRKSKLDAAAAAVILQDYLDRREL